MQYLKLSNISCYKRALYLSKYVWDIIIVWNWFEKQTVGSQFVRAIDSVSANIAEGFGRYNKKDKIKFYHYSFGFVKYNVTGMKNPNQEILSRLNNITIF